MAKLTPEIREVIDALGVFPIATSSPEGTPNLVYIAFLRVVDDETIEIADNKFFKTKQNLDANPTMSMTFWSPEKTGCYQVKGKVSLYTEGEIYDGVVDWVHTKTDNGMTPKTAVRVSVDEIYAGADKIG